MKKHIKDRKDQSKYKNCYPEEQQVRKTIFQICELVLLYGLFLNQVASSLSSDSRGFLVVDALNAYHILLRIESA